MGSAAGTFIDVSNPLGGGLSGNSMPVSPAYTSPNPGVC